MDDDGRTVHVVLTTPDGVVLGRLDPVEVGSSSWPHVAPIAEGGPGPRRSRDRGVVDFSDSVVGHPLLDMPTYLPRLPEADRPVVRAAWMAAWRSAAPGSDPERAATLVAPIASARQAAIYQAFLDAIEPAERVYHAFDPPRWLERTVTLLRRERSDSG